MPAARRRIALTALAVASVPVMAAIPIAPAQAATRTVAVTANGFSPNPQNAVAGDSVRFRNDSNVQITLTYASKWPGAKSASIPAGATSASKRLTVAGNYDVSAKDSIGVLFNVSGRVVVKKAPGPTPSKSPTPRPTRSTSSPKPSSSSATPAGSSSPATSTPASTPPTSTSQPGATASSSTSPLPEGTPTDDPPVIADGSKQSLVQSHLVRRLGLPGALAVVLLLGLLFGLGRVLLALAPPGTESAD